MRTITITAESPKTKLDLAYAIRDLLDITQRGILEVYEFEAMRKPSLITLYEALKLIKDSKNGNATNSVTDDDMRRRADSD